MKKLNISFSPLKEKYQKRLETRMELILPKQVSPPSTPDEIYRIPLNLWEITNDNSTIT